MRPILLDRKLVAELYSMHFEHRRGVAQSGSASGLGPEGRRFESYRPDQFFSKICDRFKNPKKKPEILTG